MGMNENLAKQITKIAQKAAKLRDAGKAEGHEQGKQAEYDAFWDAYQPTGSEASPQALAFAGVGWNDSNFRPKYDICFSGYCAYAFAGARITDVKGILESLGRRLDTSKVVNAMQMFYDSKTVTRLPVLDLSSATNIDYAVYNCVALTHIDKVILKSDGSQKVTTFLSSCALLENVIFEGVIGQGGLNLRWSTKLSKASIESIINCLSTTTSGLSVTLSKMAKEAAFTADEWAALIATKPNWAINLI